MEEADLYEQLNSQHQDSIFMARKNIEEMRKKYDLEHFERAIIKMQMGEH